MSVSWNTPFGAFDPLGTELSRSGGLELPAYSTNPFISPTPDLGSNQYAYGDRPSSYGQTSFAPGPRGEMFDAMSSLTGWSTITSQVDSWLAQAHPELFDFNNTSGYAGGSINSLGGDWSGVDAWNDAITNAANSTGVPANLIKAVMKLESGGANLPPNGAGAQGPMQVVGAYWNSLGFDLNDPAQNIMAGATILKQMYDQYAGWATQNGVNPWKAAVYSYYAGNPYNLNAADDPSQGGSGMSTGAYGEQIWTSFTQLQMGAGTGTGTATPGNSGQFDAITGGQPYPVTQEIGPTDFSMGPGSWMYGYGAAYGVEGHPGVDVGTPLGTKTFSPVAGTVMMSGGTGYYLDHRYGNSPQTGELLIKLDNGDELILGHMGNIAVQVGQRVSPGAYVGESGFGGDPSQGGGPHIHVEYRKIGANTSSGFQAVDPRLALGGQFTGQFGQTPGFGSGQYVPEAADWSNFMRNAATGGPLYGSGYSPGYGGSSFGSWLRSNSPWIPRSA